jgi:outer membrane lipoprotein-sorting protein
MKPKILILLFFCSLMVSAFGQTAKEIIQESEERFRGTQTMKANMTMTITRPTWERTMEMKMWSKGDDYGLILVTAPERDKGTANLKREKEVWNWMPRIERTIKLPPSMMSQSWMGSDFTNEDLVREFSLVKDYDHTIMGDSTLEERACWKIELIPHEDAAVVWGRVVMFIDKQDYLQLRTESYDEDGYLVNVMTGSKIKEMSGRTLATRMEIVPVEEEGHMTAIEYKNMKFDDPIPDAFFSIQNMKRVR